MKWIKDYDTLSKRHKIAVSIAAVVSGCLFAVLSDLYIQGYSMERALANLNILVAVSVIFMGVLMVIRSVRKKSAL